MPISGLPIELPSTTLQAAVDAVDQALWMGASDPIEPLLPAWSAAGAIGLDTEFVRERTFHPRPGLIQLSDGCRVWLLDPIDREDSPCIGEILDNLNLIKILHSVGEDLAVFRLVTGTVPQPLFDTQIAAAMLGFPLQCRYEHLVEQCLGVQLPGGKARSDWCRRPLTADLRRYAAQDVIWLPRLHSLLSEALDKVGRLAWLEEDCQRLVAAAIDDVQADPLGRVKGAGRLDDQGLAWLKRLADWRDAQARSRDLPRSFVIRDEDLLRLAAAGGRSAALNEALAGLPAPVGRRHSGTLRELLSVDPPPPLARPAELRPMDPAQREALRSAQDRVKDVADSLGLEPALLASKRELARLLLGDRPDWLSGWRGELLRQGLREVPGLESL